MYDDVLILTDGSEASDTALSHRIAITSSTGATVHLLHVVGVGIEMSASGVGDVADELTETLDEETKEAVGRAEKKANEAGVTSERVVLEGVPEDAIRQYSTDHGIDLVVVGESEDSTLSERFFGTTTDEVVQSAPVSTLVARD
ncbi:universal stress protein [Halogeometricum limi]|uniref:Nucleotide-binding universal stress protein, UspA family n=1 Tax=Halogeometricum limi TaxID=555875 RepID=A0A1I6HAM0_9EURY|nr:universal stress protein [Halogeometricum limi]SFR51546.1 Nucleotide-binding universal stress protein, UspA family [Halogeometricum limi]